MPVRGKSGSARGPPIGRFTFDGNFGTFGNGGRPSRRRAGDTVGSRSWGSGSQNVSLAWELSLLWVLILVLLPVVAVPVTSAFVVGDV